MSMHHRLGLLLLLIAAPAALLRADPPMTKITVEVKTLAGKPVDRAAVVVRFVQGRSIAKFGKKIRLNWEMRTNQDGVAKIPAIPQGDVMVQVIAKGHQTFGKTYPVDSEEKTIEVRLNPPQAQYTSHQ